MKDTIIKDNIIKLVHHYYWDLDINCARTALRSLGEIFNIPIDSQTLQSAIGLHGAGGFRAQCGLVEGAIMFIGIHFTKLGKCEAEISDICFQFAELFTKNFSSLLCYDLRPNGFMDDDPPHSCERVTVEAINFTYDFIMRVID